MARVKLLEKEDLSGEELRAYEELESRNAVTNMKRVMLYEIGNYRAFMGWYDSWKSVVEVLGEKDATIYAHAVSTTNSCMLCSLFFVSDLRGLGLDPHDFETDEKEDLLIELGRQIVKDPTKVSDELWGKLKKFWTDKELVIIVGFAAQMQATNNFNSVLRVDLDERLLPLKGDFEPATWRENLL